ncbi:DUF6701 domain-containing protein [Marinobacter sp. C2H3]|uniref:DUF6701 domain-containing protein n=1 Tax=Marinobacter sp. C2H3 TaxID=3119003 RepID=UPI00300F0049
MALWAVLMALASFPGLSQAAACSQVYAAGNGQNANLQAAGDTLDLSGVPFANVAWPASGTVLTGGDYYFRGTNLPNGYRLDVANGARVRIFVNGSLSAGNNLDLNRNRNADQFLLVVNGSLSVGNNAQIRGLVYAAGAIGVGNNGDIRGGLAAGGGISAGNRPVVADYSGLQAGLLDGLCGDALTLSANGDAVGPVTVPVGSTVNFSVEASGCPAAADPFFDDPWLDEWLIDGVAFAQSWEGAAPCTRTPAVQRTFDQVGSFTVSYQSSYCSQYTFFGLACGQYSSFGTDSIVVQVTDQTTGLTCFNDEFTGGSLSVDDWVTSVSQGNFIPSVQGNGRLRMTEAVNNQSTAATLQREIPGADNLVVLQFDYYAYGGNGADGIAVVLSDATITPQPGSYGGSLGYAQRSGGSSGFAGGWLGIGLDEYGNFANASEGRSGGIGLTPDSVTLRGSAPAYGFLGSSGSLSPGIDATGANNPHRYRITVDSRNGIGPIVTVERDISGTGNAYSELIRRDLSTVSGQSAIPANLLLSLTGSTGGSTNIHELDDVQLCALKLNPVGQQVDHFEILHDGQALTCQPETVTVRACADAGCTALFTDPVQATLAPANGWVGGNPLTITGGAGQATLQKTTAGTITLGVIGSQPTTRPQSTTLCNNGSGGFSAGQCQLTFADAGLAFDVPDLTASKPVSGIAVRAVKRDDATNACVPAFENVTRPVRFWSSYVDPGPTNRPASRAVSVQGQPVGGSSATATEENLAFGPGGVATIGVAYPDAGAMTLSALYEGSSDRGDVGLVMPGSDGFVSVPAGLCVQTAAACAAGDASCPAFVRAGAPFDLSVQAVGWQVDGDSNLCQGNPDTPNFRLAGIPLGVSLLAPAGGVIGTLAPGSYDHATAADGTTVVSSALSEVGVFRISADPVPNSYFGLTVPGGISAPIGRIYPDRFETSLDPGELAGACEPSAGTAFSYLGQPFPWQREPSLSLEPVSVQGTRTLNYTAPGFRKLTADDVLRTFPVADDTATDTLGNPLALESLADPGTLSVAEPGLLTYAYASTDRYRYLKTPQSRVAPIAPTLSFSIDQVEDSDGVTAVSAPLAFQPDAAFDLRYGRWAMENAYGPETAESLPLPFRLEYWDGNRFVANALDTCTTWNTASLTDTADYHDLTPASGDFTGSEPPALSLVPNGTPGTDTLVWNVDAWLQDDWDGNGTLENPSAIATFGVYRGNDRVIYWREVQ